MQKLKINIAGGVLDIIGAILYFIFLFVVVGTAIGEAAVGGTGSATNGVATIFYLFAVAGVAVHIVGLIQSKKANLKLTGNILGIIGHAVFLGLGAILGWAAAIVCIISAVFTLMQKPNN